MASAAVTDIREMLLRLRLAEQRQIDECMAGAAANSVEVFLQTLERKGLITSYQSSQLKKGDAAGLVLGHYALLYQNASGSFARVFRAKDLNTGKMLGLKVLRSRYAKDPKSIAEFKREAELGKTLIHENIVPIYEVGQDKGEHFLSMEFVEGGNLRDFMNIRKKLSVEEATKCTCDMASGLQYALERGLTHRDLKLTNVLMSTRGVAKLVDFGLAGLDPGNSAATDANISENNQRAIEYATLEKNTGVPRNDPRSDLYFLGAMYYELLTGVPALPRTKDPKERGEFSRYANIPPIRGLDSSLPDGAVAIVEKLMQINPTLRYQKPAEAVDDLRSVLGDPNEIPPGCRSSKSPETKNGPAVKSGTTGLGEQRPAANSTAADSPKSAMPMILCVEARLKHQDVLRSYFGKYQYRVLMFSDPKRAVSRMFTESPPAACVIIGEGLSDDALEGFKSLCLKTELPPTYSALLVLSEKQVREVKLARAMSNTACRVVQQPLTLRELHRELKQGLILTGHLPPAPPAEAGPECNSESADTVE